MAEGFIQGFRLAQSAAEPFLNAISQAQALKNKLKIEQELQNELNIQKANRLEPLINKGRGGIVSEEIPSFETPFGTKSPALRDKITGQAIDPNIPAPSNEIETFGKNIASGREIMGSLS